MAELLLATRSGTSSNFAVNAALPKAGDIIRVEQDDFNWGTFEQTNPGWRLLRVVGIRVDQFALYVAPEIAGLASTVLPSGQQTAAHPVQYRGYGMDLNSALIPADVKAYLDDDTRQTALYVIPDASDWILRVFAQKPRLTDPAIIGAVTPSIIG